MNIKNDIDESFETISLLNGLTLNMEESLKLKIALNELYKNINAEEIFFWGKIIGVERDYYVAMAMFFKEKQFPTKVFYFASSNNMVFSLLPDVKDYHVKSLFALNTYFIGVPETILEYYNTENASDVLNKNINLSFDKSENNEFGEIYSRLNKPKNLTEVDRLSYVVRYIEYECSVVPKGSVKYTPLNEMRLNDNFHGLSEKEIGDLNNYLLLRPPQTKEKKELIKRGEAILDFGFLDNVLEQNKSNDNIIFN